MANLKVHLTIPWWIRPAFTASLPLVWLAGGFPCIQRSIADGISHFLVGQCRMNGAKLCDNRHW